MGTASEPIAPGPFRRQFTTELEQLHLQVEVMAVRVDEALERMRQVLATGDTLAAEQALCGDDIIDEMNVSLTERCYELFGVRRRWPRISASSSRCCGCSPTSNGSAIWPCAW